MGTTTSKKRYIVCKILNRKNAKRRELTRFNAECDGEAISHFEHTYKRMAAAAKVPFNVELLTGDWQHLAGYTYKEELKEEN